ncbi:hypothetical protein Tco_0158874 [Tanacetum coccineum]
MFAVCACARFQVTPKTSHLNAVKRIFRYLKGQPKLGLWYPKDSPFDLEAFSDSDYAGASLDRKSTIGGCQFLGKRLISWQCKKQTIVANSTTEAEYVAAANCCGQVLWIQNQMLDYGFNFMNTKIHIDNESTICIVKNPVFHSKTKHIEIRHHFIRDSYEKKLIQVIKIHTDHNVADLLTKAFDVSRKAKRTTEISQSSRPIHLVADETVYKEWEDRMERAATTASSLEAEQDSGNINRTQSMATLNESFPQGTDSYWEVQKLKLETSIRSDLNLEDAGGTNCLPTYTIFEELARMGIAELDMTKKEHDVILKEVSAAEILTTAGIKIPVSTVAPSTTAVSHLLLPKVQSTVTIAPSTILKAKAITFRDAGETTTRTPTSVSSSSIKDKGKAKMVEPEVPLNIKKDQIRLDEELARRLDAEEQEAARLERALLHYSTSILANKLKGMGLCESSDGC